MASLWKNRKFLGEVNVKIALDCIPCLIKQTLGAARFASEDGHVHEQVLRAALRITAKADFNTSPPALGQQIHQVIRHISGKADPYNSIKEQTNQFCLNLLPQMRQIILQSRSPLETAVRLAIAGNIIDFALDPSLQDSHLMQSINDMMHFYLRESIEEFRQSVLGARQILYLADNAGEIVFDRLLIEQLPREKMTLAVRGAPIINDATRQDAIAAGLDELVDLIDTGSDAPGVLLEECSSEFRRHFANADLIISKGQGNYEALQGSTQNIYFLFKVKCSLLAEQLGRPVESGVFMRNRSPGN
jgi:damage-control phosphatase, subfamily I